MTDGITLVDTGFGDRPAFCAAYLVVEAGRAAFIDCGTLHSVPRMLEALDAAGLARDAVDFIIATHVHLDHAGGAGALLRELPAARLVVHPRGAPQHGLRLERPDDRNEEHGDEEDMTITVH